MRKVIAVGLEPPIYGPRPHRVTQLQPFEPYLRERLAAVPELSGRRLHRELAALGYRGGYTAVTDLLREIRPVVPPPFELRFETPPGQQAQVDFAQFQTEFTDDPGVVRIVWLFSLVLGHSRMMWCRFVLHQDLPTVLRCHIAAFEALGGVPQQILYDRMKTAVIGDDAEAGHIIYNRTLLDFARHYGFLPKACRPYRAKTKGKVAEGVQCCRRRDAAHLCLVLKTHPSAVNRPETEGYQDGSPSVPLTTAAGCPARAAEFLRDVCAVGLSDTRPALPTRRLALSQGRRIILQ